ncbi:MAG TPA: hypothetical protein VKU19_05995 [Bryobacteraceae bacterium]|nr:hypothetical protein [Bryobacteraceae bacterium]
MSRSTLKFLAIFLGVLIVVVYLADLDGLPRSLRNQVDQERNALAAASKQLHDSQDQVLASLRSESDLFRVVPASQQWPEQLSKLLGDVQLASHDMDELSALVKRDRRADRAQIETLLSQERNLRTSAVNDATAIQKDAAHWVDVKNHLPDEARQMEQSYAAIHAIDLAPVTGVVQKAETDWPDKARNLEKRLGELRDTIAQADQAWQSSEQARQLAAANDFAHLDLPAFVAADTTLKNAAESLPQQNKKLASHANQLYYAWDKILVDMDVRSGDHYTQKIRTVETRFPDASAKNGDTTSKENWVEVPQATYEADKNDLGMAIEHKPAGMYESEADHVPQPAGFAYVAPPDQGRNQYGYWDHRDGRDFWVFYGQYALMRDLLWNNQYQPIEPYEWTGYRTYYSRGQTYYGGDPRVQSAPRYGTQGSTTQSRYSTSTYASRGGFKNSQYASKSGSYGSSKYATPSGGTSTPRQFGSGSNSNSPRSTPSARPSAPRSPSRSSSPPRRFGKH